MTSQYYPPVGFKSSQSYSVEPRCLELPACANSNYFHLNILFQSRKYFQLFRIPPTSATIFRFLQAFEIAGFNRNKISVSLRSRSFQTEQFIRPKCEEIREASSPRDKYADLASWGIWLPKIKCFFKSDSLCHETVEPLWLLSQCTWIPSSTNCY